MSLQAIYAYDDEHGCPRLRKTRSSPKKFSMQSAKYANDLIYWRPGVKHQAEFAERAMYNLPVLVDALKYHEPVFALEGERDCQTLASLKKVPTTTNWQGASAFTEEQAAWFLHARSRSDIVIIRDADDAGVHAAWQRYSRLIAVGVARNRIRLYVPTGGAKDITAAALAGRIGSAVRREWPSAVKEAAFRVSAEKVARYMDSAS